MSVIHLLRVNIIFYVKVKRSPKTVCVCFPVKLPSRGQIFYCCGTVASVGTLDISSPTQRVFQHSNSSLMLVLQLGSGLSCGKAKP